MFFCEPTVCLGATLNISRAVSSYNHNDMNIILLQEN